MDPKNSPQISQKYAEAATNSIITELRSIDGKLLEILKILAENQELAKKQQAENDIDLNNFQAAFSQIGKTLETASQAAIEDYKMRKVAIDEYNHGQK